MVKEGVTASKWEVDGQLPIVIGATKKIDYIYVIISDYNEKLDKDKNFGLIFSNKKFANSSFDLDVSKRSNNEIEYAVKVNYHCNDYGGALVTYTLQISVPDCGTAFVMWKKLCGNPTLPRDGFTVLLEEQNSNKTVVKDGMVINGSFFDQDVDNYAYFIPENVDKSTFYISMSNDLSSNPFFSEDDDPIVMVLRDMIRSVPETKVSKIKVDSDDTILIPSLMGDLVGGGIITNKFTKVTLNYKCKGRKAKATVELNIPLDFFKDVSLYFVKMCDGVMTAYNFFKNHKQLYDSVPYLNSFLKFLANNRYIANTYIGRKLSNYQEIKMNNLQSGRKEEDDETSFQIETHNDALASNSEKLPQYRSIN